uniref:Uncharacterized protein n=1 Tax=Mycena chlorophos TaxID=658473 RepID=A0ABQ0LEJ1_MYCCL|nr:predicted protein [Mycena chlorophos]
MQHEHLPDPHRRQQTQVGAMTLVTRRLLLSPATISTAFLVHNPPPPFLSRHPTSVPRWHRLDASPERERQNGECVCRRAIGGSRVEWKGSRVEGWLEAAWVRVETSSGGCGHPRLVRRVLFSVTVDVGLHRWWRIFSSWIRRPPRTSARFPLKPGLVYRRPGSPASAASTAFCVLETNFSLFTLCDFLNSIPRRVVPLDSATKATNGDRSITARFRKNNPNGHLKRQARQLQPNNIRSTLHPLPQPSP